MKYKFLFMLSIVFTITGCFSTKNIKPLRYDGIYKEHHDSKVIYKKFDEKKKIYHTVSYTNSNDQKALSDLDEKAKSDIKHPSRYANDEKKVRIYGGNKSMSWHGKFKKNKNGELKNNFFIKVKNNKIQEVLDLRVKDSYQIYFNKLKLSTSSKFEEIHEINEQYCVIKQNDKYGVFDTKNRKIKVPIKYQWIETKQYTNIMIPFKINNKYGFFDSDLNIAIKAQYNEVKDNGGSQKYFFKGIQSVKLKDKWLIIDKFNNHLTKNTLDYVGKHNSKKFVPIYDNQKQYYEFIDITTKKSTGVKSHKNFTSGEYQILNIGKNKYMIYSKDGKKIFNNVFESIFPYSSKKNKKVFFLITVDGKKGIIDNNGKVIVPTKYSRLNIKTDFNEDIKYFDASSGVGYGKHFLYDINGKVILNNYRSVNLIHGEKNYIHVKYSTKHSLIDEQTKKLVFETNYIWHVHKTDNYIMFRKKGLYGIIDFKLNVVVEAEHKNIKDIWGKYYAIYSSGESSIYKFGQEDELLEVDGKVDFKEKYITVYDHGDYSIYNYNFKKLNKKNLTLIQECSNNKQNSFIVKNEKNQWGVVKDKNIEYLGGNFESVTCGAYGTIIAKLKSKSIK